MEPSAAVRLNPLDCPNSPDTREMIFERLGGGPEWQERSRSYFTKWNTFSERYWRSKAVTLSFSPAENPASVPGQGSFLLRLFGPRHTVWIGPGRPEPEYFQHRLLFSEDGCPEAASCDSGVNSYEVEVRGEEQLLHPRPCGGPAVDIEESGDTRLDRWLIPLRPLGNSLVGRSKSASGFPPGVPQSCSRPSSPARPSGISSHWPALMVGSISPLVFLLLPWSTSIGNTIRE